MHKKFLLTLTIFAILLFQSCGNKNDPKPELTAQQKAAKALSQVAWGGTGKVTVNDHPSGLEPADYQDVLNLRLIFGVDAENNPGSFEAEDGGRIFPPFSGSWNWSGTGTNISAITISGSNPDITQLVEFEFIPDVDHATSIRFKFNSQCSSCRAMVVTGDYTVTLAR